ncbi:hypothetical protein SAMN05216350_105115 [Polaromonas sp. YR568]|nr:hypothetical protein SAMN05216350_105115 [Polaromonas sp. YR568]
MSLSHWFRSLVYCAVLLCLSACSKSPEVLVPAGLLEVPYAIQSIAWHPNGKLLAVGYFLRDEVEVWDIENKKSLFVIPSRRRPGNSSGQEALFSADGKYVVAQDFVDTKNGEPKFPRIYDDPAELPAQQDKTRYILARVWDLEQRKEIAQLAGPGSRLYGGSADGFCQSSALPSLVVVHRSSVVATYEIATGKFAGEVNARNPFADKPDQHLGYWRMSCHPTRPEVALEGAQFFKRATIFGFPENSGTTPIVIVDMEHKGVKKVLFNPALLKGIAYTADGSKLVSFGASPTRVWDTNNGFALVGEMANPPRMDWVSKQFFPVDELNPPQDAPRGIAGDLSAVPGSNLMIGLGSALHFWDTTQLRIVATAPAPRETLRIAMHAPEGTLAVAELNLVHFYRFNPAALPPKVNEK